MRRIIIAGLVVCLLSSIAWAQSRKDVCHVYVVDVAEARKAAESFRESGSAEADAKALSKGQTVFPEFRPVKGEEELTTNTHRLKGFSSHSHLASARGEGHLPFHPVG